MTRLETLTKRPGFPLLVASIWALGACAFAWGLASAFPVSFREDDAGYLAWAAGSGSLVAAWDPARGTLFGMFRPVVNMWWQGLYRLAGLDSYYYHIALAGLYAVLLGVFFFAASSIYGKKTGALALALWLPVFYFLQYVVFWFSGYVYILETLFLCAAAGFAALAIRGVRWSLLGGVVFHVLAALTKEPAALILPGIYAGLVIPLGFKRIPIRTLAVLVITSLAGIAWVLLKPGIEGRLGVFNAWKVGELTSFLWIRWSFYADFLAAGTGKLLWFGFAYGFLRTFFKSRGIAPEAGSIAGACLFAAVTIAPPAALLALAAVSLFWILRDRSPACGLVWFWLPIFAVLLIDFQTRTYLFEGSFGAALALAYAFQKWPAGICALSKRLPFRWFIPIVAILVLAIGGGAWKIILPKYQALVTVTAVRGNFSSLLAGTARAARHTPLILVPDYEHTGLDWEKDVLRAPDGIKASLQKPMRPGEFLLLLDLLGSPGKEPDRLDDSPSEAILVLMTNHEMDWWKNLAATNNISGEILESWERNGQRAALVKIPDATGFRKRFLPPSTGKQ